MSSIKGILSIFSVIAVPLRIIEWARIRRISKNLARFGWVAENVHERTTVEIKGAGLTFFRSRPLWALDPMVMDVRGNDTIDGRTHGGELKFEPGLLTARRSVDYDRCYERCGQRIEFSANYTLIHVQPEQAGYGRHILRPARGLLMLS